MNRHEYPLWEICWFPSRCSHLKKNSVTWMQIVIFIIRMSILFWSAIMMSKSFYLSSSFCIMRVFRFCVRHPWWRMKAKLAIVFTYFFGPDSLRKPPVVADFFFIHFGKPPHLKICFQQYFGITRRNIFKKKIR